MITPTVNAEKIREAVAELRKIEGEQVKLLRQELRSKISPFAKEIAQNVPQEPPLSNFAHDGVTSWSDVTPKISFTPGRSRKTGNHLVSIRIQPRAGKRGLYIAELAGSRNQVSGRNRGYVRQTSSGPVTVRPHGTNSGRALIQNLNSRFKMKGRGGRFAYTKFRSLRPMAVQLATGTIKRYMEKVNRKLKF